MKQFGVLAFVALSLTAGLTVPAIAQDAGFGVRQPYQCNPPDVYNGFGRCNYADGLSYIGNFREGLPNGRGTFSGAGSFRYDGEFVNGEPEGEGRLILADDFRYEGTFRDGAIVQGSAFFPNGDRYDGSFAVVSGSSQPDGKGKYTFANGNRFEGEFFAGEPFGLGTFTHSTGTVCRGYFFTRNFDGRNATCNYRNGDRYDGELRQGRPHGTGTMTRADGRVISGAFRDGQPVSFSGYGGN
jgi:hypothetical protein